MIIEWIARIGSWMFVIVMVLFAIVVIRRFWRG